MDNKDSYFLDPKIRKQILSSSNKSTLLPSDTVSESHFFEAICSLPFPIHKNIRPGLRMTEYLELLMQDTHTQASQHNKIQQCSHEIENHKKQIEEATCQKDLLEQKIIKLNKAIRKEKLRLSELQTKSKSAEKKPRGQPKKSEDPDAPIINELIRRWIDGLKIELNFKGNSGLEKVVFGSNRGNWEKWSKGERRPQAKTMYKYLSMKIKAGKHKGKKLIDVPISDAPTNFDIFNLICRDLVFEDGLINFDGKIQS